MISNTHIARAMAVAIVLFSSAVRANEEKAWSISKSSGEVWTITAGAQQASLSQGADLKPGETIRTGRNGRVLLVRGQESILIAPNSSISIPKDTGDLSTTIIQQAGSILLDVEKRNVKHFAVETPFLAAVVKGTQFRVSVNAAGTSVNVLQGQVEVADFRSGQIARVLPGQAAASSASGPGGLALTGSGVLSPIEQGKPRPTAVDRLMVPRNGLTAPRGAANAGQFRSIASAAGPKPSQANRASTSAQGRDAVRIRSTIGQVRLNVNRATNGMARSTTSHSQSGRSASQNPIWTDSPAAAAASGNALAAATAAPGASRGNGNSESGNTEGAVGNGRGNNNAVAGNGNGRGNGGNGNGNGGGNGNGNGGGNGNGNGGGNGNGNSGGNGNGNGAGNGNGNGGKGKN